MGQKESILPNSNYAALFILGQSVQQPLEVSEPVLDVCGKGRLGNKQTCVWRSSNDSAFTCSFSDISAENITNFINQNAVTINDWMKVKKIK